MNPTESFQPENDEGPWDPASGVSWGDFRKSQPHICASLAALPLGCAELLPTAGPLCWLCARLQVPSRPPPLGLSCRGLPWATPLSLLSGCSCASRPSTATPPTQAQTRAGTCLSWSRCGTVWVLPAHPSRHPLPVGAALVVPQPLCTSFSAHTTPSVLICCSLSRPKAGVRVLAAGGWVLR